MDLETQSSTQYVFEDFRQLQEQCAVTMVERRHIFRNDIIPRHATRIKRRQRIGPRSAQLVAWVAANPGMPMIHAARHVGHNGSTNLGYRIVRRAIKAGLVSWIHDNRVTKLFPLFF